MGHILEPSRSRIPEAELLYSTRFSALKVACRPTTPTGIFRAVESKRLRAFTYLPTSEFAGLHQDITPFWRRHLFTQSATPRFTALLLCRSANSPHGIDTDALTHRSTEALNRRCTHPPIHASTASPIHPFTASPSRCGANSPICIFADPPCHPMAQTRIHSVGAPCVFAYA